MDAFEGEEVSKKKSGANFVKSGSSKDGESVEVYKPSQHRVESTSRSARVFEDPSKVSLLYDASLSKYSLDF